MKVLFNTSYMNYNMNFKAGKVASLAMPVAESKIKSGYSIESLYKKSSMYLRDQISKREFLDEFYNFYDNAQAKNIKLNRDENIFMANIAMSLDMTDEDIIQDKFLKKDIKRLLDTSCK